MGVRVEMQRIGPIGGGIQGPPMLGPVVVGVFVDEADGWRLLDPATGTFDLTGVVPDLEERERKDGDRTATMHGVIATVRDVVFISETPSASTDLRRPTPVDELITRPLPR